MAFGQGYTNRIQFFDRATEISLAGCIGKMIPDVFREKFGCRVLAGKGVELPLVLVVGGQVAHDADGAQVALDLGRAEHRDDPGAGGEAKEKQEGGTNLSMIWEAVVLVSGPSSEAVAVGVEGCGGSRGVVPCGSDSEFGPRSAVKLGGGLGLGG